MPVLQATNVWNPVIRRLPTFLCEKNETNNDNNKSEQQQQTVHVLTVAAQLITLHRHVFFDRCSISL